MSKREYHPEIDKYDDKQVMPRDKPRRNGIQYSNALQQVLINDAHRNRIKNWKHVGLIILAIPLLVIASVAGMFFLPAFWGLRWLAEIEYQD